MTEYTKEEKLSMALLDAQSLINALVKLIDWDEIPATFARDVARLRTHIAKTLEGK